MRQASASPPGACKQGGWEKTHQFSVELVAPVFVHVPQQEPPSGVGPGGTLRPSASSLVEVAPAQVSSRMDYHRDLVRSRAVSRRLAAFLHRCAETTENVALLCLGGLPKRARAQSNDAHLSFSLSEVRSILVVMAPGLNECLLNMTSPLW